jgi:hypothetical protein
VETRGKLPPWGGRWERPAPVPLSNTSSPAELEVRGAERPKLLVLDI